MQSSSRIIRNKEVTGKAVIDTKLDFAKMRAKNSCDEPKVVSVQHNFNAVGYSTGLIDEAQKEAFKIRSKAYNDAVEIEKNAHASGFEQGVQEGFSKGYEEGYQKAIQEVYNKEQEILSEAAEILIHSKNFKMEYLDHCKGEIKGVIATALNGILKKSFLSDDILDGIVIDHLRELKNEEEVVFHMNSFYYDHINTYNRQWLEDMNSNTIVKIIVDDSYPVGKMTIEKSDGKINVDLSNLDGKINDVIFSE